MVFAAGLVLAVTQLASALGPLATGVLAAFPIASSVIAVFSHRYHSPWHAVFALRALKQGLISLLAFFYALVLLAAFLTFDQAFILAAVVAIAIQTCVGGGAQAVLRRCNAHSVTDGGK